MYGSIFNLKPKKGKKKALLNSFKDAADKDVIPNEEGMIAWHVMDPDNGGDLIAVAIFKDKESYTLNAEKPETHENFIQMMEYLEEEPVWNDGLFII